MKENIDIRAGYRLPDGYFEDFSARMAVMASRKTEIQRRMSFMRRTMIAVSSAAAAVVLAVGLTFLLRNDDPARYMASASTDVLITSYFGASESEVIDYYYLPVESDESESISDEDILDYLASSGGVNLYSLLENQ